MGPTAGPGHIDTTSRVKKYTTVAALTMEAPLVAYVTATDQVETKPNASTTRQVTVDRVVRGSAPGQTIAVREYGRAGSDTSLVSGKRYLVFVHPYEIMRGHPTGEWVVVGAYAGLWSVSAGTVTRLDPDTPMPSRLTMTEMDSQIRAAGR